MRYRRACRSALLFLSVFGLGGMAALALRGFAGPAVAFGFLALLSLGCAAGGFALDRLSTPPFPDPHLPYRGWVAKHTAPLPGPLTPTPGMANRKPGPARGKVDPKWMRGPADAQAVREGCYFDEAAARQVCDFIETFCKQSKGRWAGQPLELLPWQRDFLMRLFGWKRPDGRRRYTTAYLEVAKKNGKSTLVSALTIVLLLADGEGAPEVYLNAVDREQASIVFDEAARMVRASPCLDRRLRVIDSKKRIVDPKGHGLIRANSADVPSKDGVNAHGVIFDELHRQRDRLLWEIFEYASESREQPLKLSITTAGEEETGVWHEQREYSEKVNRGEILDTTHLGVVYRALPADDPADPETWKKANPSLGVTLSLDGFRRAYEKAKQNPLEWNNFLRLRLGVVARAEGKYIDPPRWAACGGKVPPLDRLRGRRCYVGGDLSSTTDLTAVVAVWPDEAGSYFVRAWFYYPEENLAAAERRDKAPYRLWADQGWITPTPGEAVDYEFVRRDLNALAAGHDLEVVELDPFNAVQLAQNLANDGLRVELLRQGFLSLSPPTKELERLVVGRRLRHGDNPVLTWCVLNAVAVKDEAGNVKLSKKKSRLRIDGAAALVNAIAAATAGEGDGGDGSVYDRRGILLI